MKKKFKSLLALVAAFAIVFTMSITSFAAEGNTTTPTADTTTYTLTLTGTTTGHIYEAYQIFKGDLSGTTLSNIKWGSGVTDPDNLVTDLKNDATLKDTFSKVTDAASVAEALSKVQAQKDDPVAKEFATVVSKYLSTTKTIKDSAAEQTKISGLTAGYYLVKDQDKSINSTKQDAYTRFILEVVANTSAAVKSDVPTVEKKVKDTNDSTGETTDWQDSADADINDDVQYQITGTMPKNIADYTTYKYVFTDTMSKGLTYTANNAKIKIGNTDVTGSFTEAITKDNDSTVVTWTCDNLKGIDGVTLDENTKVVVTYSATLNKDAVIGAAGNPNEVYLTYSNNPNKGGDGDTGTTPKDKNIVFTYQVVVNKVDKDSKPLAGAEFTLSKVKADNTLTVVNTFTLTGDKEKDATTFTASGLDDGTYVLKETKTPAGYNTIADQYFTIKAVHDANSNDPKLMSLSGDKLTGSAITFTPDTNAGSLTTNIVNEKGSNLPSTGGRGTMLIFILGAALAAGAVIIKVASKKKA
ncbi:MAG: SpaH/EbpB family LPXTG-anchored major pilin [Lachnospiraceae bacterium]|nr:SpaH/EbpB family LPXTG-anchored major pilin [Lachnospiraceae bacterium]